MAVGLHESGVSEVEGRDGVDEHVAVDGVGVVHVLHPDFVVFIYVKDEGEVEP